MHCIHALLPNHWKKVQLHFDDHLSNGGSHKQMQRPHAFSMLLIRLYTYVLTIKPQAIILIARFTFHEHVIDPLDISRNPRKEKGKKIASSLVISSSSDNNEAPSFLKFYDELSDSEDLTKAQREKRGMFKCLN
ncbi:hypothetical protein Tco_1341669 [Tanacetum coccineum]